MNELLAFLLPPATALAGMRLARWVLGDGFSVQFGFGFRFAFGLLVGMLVFSQTILLCSLTGIDGAGLLARLALIWGGVELFLLAKNAPASLKTFRIRPAHLWLLLLLPLAYSWWVFGRLSTLEGTLEFDANAFWVFKAKILYLEQGKDLIQVLHESNLAYMHMDYPMLVPCLYTLDYGLVGKVDEFVNKVWPFWMMVALCVGVLSMARLLQKPRPLPIAIVTIIAFLPASLQFIRNEGGTIPILFCISMASLLLVRAIYNKDEAAAPAIILAFAVSFSAKFEGAVYASFCSCMLLPFFLRRSWYSNKILWKSAAAACVSLLPYLFYRLTKPIPHPESNWLHEGLADPHATLRCFPQMWFLSFFGRIFSPEFFHWDAEGHHLHWIGHWSGWGIFTNNYLSVLPWLLLALLLFSLIFNPRSRVLMGVLAAVFLGVWTFVSLVTAALSEMHNDLAHVINFASDSDAGRLYYPFFTAWFLAIAAVWFPNESNSQMPEQKSKTNPRSMLK